MVYTEDSKSSGFGLTGSSPVLGIMKSSRLSQELYYTSLIMTRQPKPSKVSSEQAQALNLPPEPDILDQAFLNLLDGLTRDWTALSPEGIRKVVSSLQELQKGIPPRELVRKHWYLTEGVWNFVQTTKHQMLISDIYMLGLCAKNWVIK